MRDVEVCKSKYKPIFAGLPQRGYGALPVVLLHSAASLTQSTFLNELLPARPYSITKQFQSYACHSFIAPEERRTGASVGRLGSSSRRTLEVPGAISQRPLAPRLTAERRVTDRSRWRPNLKDSTGKPGDSYIATALE